MFNYKHTTYVATNSHPVFAESMILKFKSHAGQTHKTEYAMGELNISDSTHVQQQPNAFINWINTKRSEGFVERARGTCKRAT